MLIYAYVCVHKLYLDQWYSFVKQEPSQASQSEICVRVQAPRAVFWGSEGKFRDFICKIMQSSAFSAGKMVRNAVYDAFVNTITYERRSQALPLEM